MSASPRRAREPRVALRPLPAAPSIELERKHAKALLRRARDGDLDALSRIGAQTRHEAPYRLADAQRTLASEYGFANWADLIRYFETLARPDALLGVRARRGVERYEARAEALAVRQLEGDAWVARSVAAFVPRFFGLPVDDVRGRPLTIDEARLVIARQLRFANWDALIAHTTMRVDDIDPLQRQFADAIMESDLDAVEALIAAHPDAFDSWPGERRAFGFLNVAIIHDCQQPSAISRAIVDRLVARAGTEPLSALLLRNRLHADDVEYLVGRGADPLWIPPNGISLLEHAILRYQNGAAVDALAKRSPSPRDALWIAAGLGDLEGVRGHLRRDGKPRASAYADRPDLSLLGGVSITADPFPDATEILNEVMLVAVLNGRVSVIEFLVSRGVSANHDGWGGDTWLTLAVTTQSIEAVTALIAVGADPDHGGSRGTTARSRSMDFVEAYAVQPDKLTIAQRIAQLFGAGQVSQSPRRKPTLDPSVTQLLELAADDAARQHRSEVDMDSYNVAMARLGGPRDDESDIDLNDDIDPARLLPPDDRIEHEPIPLSYEVSLLIDRAVALAESNGHDVVSLNTILHTFVLSLVGTEYPVETMLPLLERAGQAMNAARRLADLYDSDQV